MGAARPSRTSTARPRPRVLLEAVDIREGEWFYAGAESFDFCKQTGTVEREIRVPTKLLVRALEQLGLVRAVRR